MFTKTCLECEEKFKAKYEDTKFCNEDCYHLSRRGENYIENLQRKQLRNPIFIKGQLYFIASFEILKNLDAECLLVDESKNIIIGYSNRPQLSELELLMLSV